jgi:phosphoketolase
MAKMLDDRMLGLVDAYWRASNYLTVGQIYLRDNPLLREPLRALGNFARAELHLRPSEPSHL